MNLLDAQRPYDRNWWKFFWVWRYNFVWFYCTDATGMWMIPLTSQKTIWKIIGKRDEKKHHGFCHRILIVVITRFPKKTKSVTSQEISNVNHVLLFVLTSTTVSESLPVGNFKTCNKRHVRPASEASTASVFSRTPAGNRCGSKF